MKKFIALFLALVLALGLMACASSATTETTTQPAETTTTTEETKTEEAAPAEETSEETAPAAAGSVYWLNFKPESDEVLQKVAAMYTEKTGVPVTVVTAASGTYNVFRDMTAPFGVAIFVPMFVTGMTKKAATGMAVPAAAASALHSVALVQLICVIVGIVVCFLIPSVHKKAEAAKE